MSVVHQPMPDSISVDAGRKAFLAGRMAMKAYANASSPVVGLIE